MKRPIISINNLAYLFQDDLEAIVELEAYCDELERERDNLKNLVSNSNTIYLSMRDERDKALLKGTPCGECNATGAIYVGNSDIDLDGERLCKKCGGTGML